ncbi:hypothetical protein A5727_16905 [Mycobacterium sp. ACS4331]|nr:hypothetical protein A5727_16905 [Mycobacterium sp. ACS4331]
MNMTEGTLTEWLVQVGDSIGVGDDIAVIETDKVETNLESPYEGTVDELCVEEGDDVQVAETVIYIRTE